MKKELILKALSNTLNNLSADTLKHLSAYTLNNLSAYALNNLSAYALNNLSADTLKHLSAYTLKHLSADTLKHLSAYTLNNLSADTLKHLSAYTLKHLSAYTLNNLSADTLNNLSADTLKHLNIIKEIPLLNKPYSILLADINNNNRLYNQSDWGNITEYDANNNLCNTAMCIAGHFVNMCGAKGYELKDRFGWETAAELIHLQSSPNTPIFNYYNTNNAVGLAYIEMMSEFENRLDEKQTFDEYISMQLK
jgi:hypothetical protein